MNLLQDKTAVITGGSRGLGFAIAEAYAQEGAAVVIGSRTPASLDLAVERIRSQGYQASGIPCDVVDLTQVQALAQHAEQQFGGIDIWVNNAGLPAPIGPTMHIPPHYVHGVINTNITGTYNGSRVAIQYFARQRHGKLINLSGRGEKSPTPMFNPYGASKSWVYSFTKSLAKEYKDSGIGIFLFQPSLVRSDMMANLYFIDGYVDWGMRIFNIISRLISLPPELPADKAIWLASSATDGKTGLHINLLTKTAMLKGAAHELGRIITRRPAPKLDVQITVIPPDLDLTIKEETTGTGATLLEQA